MRNLGKTGGKSSIITLGGCGLGVGISQKEADKAIKLALNADINMIDTAPTYGNAEDLLYPWIKKYRNKFFLAEKTMERSYDGALKELHESMDRLGTNYFDLYQFHAVRNQKELKQIFGKKGAMKAFKEAQETGLIKFIGFTGHDDIRIHIEALEMFDFDTVLAPINVASKINSHPTNDYEKLLNIALDRNVGVIAIKAILKRRWKTEIQNEQPYKTWYEPLDQQEAIDKTIWFTLSQEGVTTYSIPCDIRLWPMVIDAGKRFQRLNDKQQEEIIKYARTLELSPLFPET
ncbi:MAG: aldo/keto reductase [Candidatus Hodarchaeales archaeon]|jgi:aryl-alcohol dehydrogenase-like predicted oxidoreductase